MRNAKVYILWGWHSAGLYGPAPIKLTGGTLASVRKHMRDRGTDGGWVMEILPEGQTPTGLRERVAATRAGHVA